ncbi:TniB family NTP-binding protein [Umezakia ovalisporum]|uniref:TniB family NTP-binding protein n=1 Tax=Umezakia ovalisporum TaxID=75695 RepID=UPI0035B996F6
MGELPTGKTVACDAYKYRQKVQAELGRPPIVPVIYIQPPQKCGAKDLFKEIIEYLKFKATKETVLDFRNRYRRFPFN